jgi:hypothetical protein
MDESQLNRMVDAAVDRGDRSLLQAIEKGWLTLDDLPEDVRQRLAGATTMLEGKIKDGVVEIDPPPQSTNRTRRNDGQQGRRYRQGNAGVEDGRIGG